jgi:hypothetical protein
VAWFCSAVDKSEFMRFLAIFRGAWTLQRVSAANRPALAALKSARFLRRAFGKRCSAGIFALVALAGCLSNEDRYPSEAEMNAAKAAWELELAERAKRGRELVNSMVALHGPSQTYTVWTSNVHLRYVITNVAPKEDQFCANVRARTEGVMGYEGRWVNFDVSIRGRPTETWTLPQDCFLYSDWDRFALGDKRPKRLQPN